jgi:hypothetical protein
LTELKLWKFDEVSGDGRAKNGGKQ